VKERGQFVDHVFELMRFERQDDDVDGTSVGDPFVRGGVRREIAAFAEDAHASFAYRLQVRAAGDKRYLAAPASQGRSDKGANRPSTDNGKFQLDPIRRTALKNRWIQLGLGILAMIMVANLQYGWTLFVPPMAAEHRWPKGAIQLAFTLFVLTETWLVPVEGYFIDRFGLRPMVALGGILVGAAWLIDAKAPSLGVLYVGAVSGGIGAGIIYGATIGNSVKWFPDRRGFAAGLTAGGFGAGAALTVIPIANMIKSSGYHATFATFGVIQGAVVLVVAALLVKPPVSAGDDRSAGAAIRYDAGAAPKVVLRTSTFYLLYGMFVMIATGGLMITAQLSVMATDFKIADTPVSLLGITLAALPFALALDRIFNGLSRPVFGAISDRIGRENTMAIAFGAQAAAIVALLSVAHDALLFVVLSGLTFFTAGEIYSLFPALCTDIFGRRYATINYGLLYTAKGVAALLVPIGSYVTAVTGSWNAIFEVIVAFNVITALLAVFALKPLRRQTQAWLTGRLTRDGALLASAAD
jgi:OFA family oxalate/formate antiporter-like MFS transporter